MSVKYFRKNDSNYKRCKSKQRAVERVLWAFVEIEVEFFAWLDLVKNLQFANELLCSFSTKMYLGTEPDQIAMNNNLENKRITGMAHHSSMLSRQFKILAVQTFDSSTIESSTEIITTTTSSWNTNKKTMTDRMHHPGKLRNW